MVPSMTKGYTCAAVVDLVAARAKYVSNAGDVPLLGPKED